MEKTGRPLDLDDLLKVEYLSSPALSTGGSAAYYVVSVCDRSTGGFLQSIWVAATDGSGANAFVGGTGRIYPGANAKAPLAAPDGTLYFLCDEGNPGVFQLWRLSAGSDATERLSSLRHGVKRFCLAPGGQAAVVEGPLWEPELEDDVAFAELKGSELEAWDAARRRAPIVVEELVYKLDDAHGILDGSVPTLAWVPLDGASPHLLGAGKVPHLNPSVSPDGHRIACWCQPHDGWKKTASELCIIDAQTGAERVLTNDGMGLVDAAPVWQDDSSLVFAAYAVDDEALHGQLYELDLDAEDAKPRALLAAEAGCFGPGLMVTGHTAYGDPGTTVALDGDGLLFLTGNRGVQGAWRLPAADGAAARVTPDACCVHGFAASDQAIVYIKGDETHLADLYALDRATGAERLLAHHNVWADELALPEPRELVTPSPTGDGTLIRGWVLDPAPDTVPAGEKPPIVLDVHGGPECCYPIDWWFEFYYLSSRGMAVAWCDPHGSVSFGPAYQKGAWDGTAQRDLMAFLDAAIAATGADPARAGVTGGSYGGFMTNQLVSTEDRFAAAVTQRNLCNRATSYGTGDMGTIFEEEPFRGVLGQLMGRMRGRSTTLKMIDDVTCPLLVLHATADYRCGFEQGEQFYHAMKDRHADVPSRFAAFPGENHGLTRDGNVWAQRGHLLEMADWFVRFLKPNTADSEEA